MTRSNFLLSSLAVASTLAMFACARDVASTAGTSESNATDNAADASTAKNETPAAACNIEWKSVSQASELKAAEGGTTTAIASADLDNDGRAELIVVRGITVSTFSGGKEGLKPLASADITFGENDALRLGAISGLPIVAADLDKDGKADLVAQARFRKNGDSETETKVFVLRGKGDGNFEAPVIIFGAVDSAVQLLAGDVDKSGSTDLVLRATKGTFLARSEEGKFRITPTNVPAVKDNDEARLGDIDGDGKLDVLIGTRGTGEWFLNDAKAGFGGEKKAFSLPADETTDTALVDVDGDGKAERVTTGKKLVRASLVVQGPSFPDAEIAHDRFLGFADFDRDQKPDALLGGKTLAVACNLQALDKVPTIAEFTPAVTDLLAVGDFDGDGRADVVTLEEDDKLSVHYTLAKEAPAAADAGTDATTPEADAGADAAPSTGGGEGPEPTKPTGGKDKGGEEGEVVDGDDDDLTLPKSPGKTKTPSTTGAGTPAPATSTPAVTTKQESGGCSTTPMQGGGSSSAFAVLGTALALGALRRRRK